MVMGFPTPKRRIPCATAALALALALAAPARWAYSEPLGDSQSSENGGNGGQSHIRGPEEINALLKAVLAGSRSFEKSAQDTGSERTRADEGKQGADSTPKKRAVNHKGMAPESAEPPPASAEEKPRAPPEFPPPPAEAGPAPDVAPPVPPTLEPPAPQPVAEIASGLPAMTFDSSQTTTPTEPVPAARQVRIRARILEWNHDRTLDWGFGVRKAPVLDADGHLVNPDLDEALRMADLFLPSQAQQLNQGLAIFLKGLNKDGDIGMGAFVQALEQLGDVKVLCSPEIVLTCPDDEERARVAALPVEQRAAAERKGIVSTKSRIPYESVQPAGNVLVEVTAYKDAATQMTVTNPEIIRDRFVKMTVNAGVTDLSGYIAVGTNSRGEIMMVPQTDSRSITNTVLVADRQMFIMGVLKTTSEHTNVQGVPWLSRIPLVGYLFKNHQARTRDQELLFIVQPEIIRG